MSIERRRPPILAADLEAWLAELGIEPLARHERDGVTSWDLVLDGRRRFDIRTTVILDPRLAVIVWIHYAPPLNDSFRATYQKLLRWNDQYPFTKFALGEDFRLILTTELPARTLDRDELGVALARLLALCDELLDESKGMIGDAGPRAPGRVPLRAPERVSRQVALFARYAEQLAEMGG